MRAGEQSSRTRMKFSRYREAVRAIIIGGDRDEDYCTSNQKYAVAGAGDKDKGCAGLAVSGESDYREESGEGSCQDFQFCGGSL